VFDAENYSRSCTSVLLHDGEQRDVNRFEAAAPRARCAGDDINSYVVVSVLHKTFSADETIYEQIALLVSTRLIWRMSEDKRSCVLCQPNSLRKKIRYVNSLCYAVTSAYRVLGVML
jgi:hypothetical protein